MAVNQYHKTIKIFEGVSVRRFTTHLWIQFGSFIGRQFIVIMGLYQKSVNTRHINLKITQKNEPTFFNRRNKEDKTQNL